MAPEQLLDLVACTATASVTAFSATLCQTLGRERGSAGNSLAAFFLCLALSAVVSVAVASADHGFTREEMRWFRVFNIPIAYLFGPLLWRYTVTLLAGSAAMPPIRRTWHVVPSVLGAAYAWTDLATGIDATPAGGVLHLVVFHGWVLHGVPYLVAAARLTLAARPALEQVSSDEANLRLAWLRTLVALFCVMWLVFGVDRVVVATTGKFYTGVGNLITCLMVAASCALAWFGVRQRSLMPAALAPDFAPPAAAARQPAASRYERSGLTPAELTQICADLEKLVREERLYADSALDLQTLSDRSGWPPNYISQALNQALGRNFFEFVNGFRIAAAERCLADPADNRAVLDIAMACGFGSKSTFNTVFKRMTGVTPSEFRRRTFEPAGSDV